MLNKALEYDLKTDTNPVNIVQKIPNRSIHICMTCLIKIQWAEDRLCLTKHSRPSSYLWLTQCCINMNHKAYANFRNLPNLTESGKLKSDMEVKVRQSVNATLCIPLPTPHSDLQQQINSLLCPSQPCSKQSMNYASKKDNTVSKSLLKK